MARKFRWTLDRRLVGGLALAAMWFLLAATLAHPQAAEEKGAQKAIEDADPDQVNPVDIQGERYTLDFRFDHPEPIVVTTPEGDREVYWYLVYTITNSTAEEHRYVPVFTLYSDTATVEPAGLYPNVFEAIKRSRKIRFLENAVEMIGKILPGEDNARTGVAIFAPLDRKTDSFTIFVGGLSGEYVERPNPAATADTPDEEKVIRLRKTLALEYKFPGDEWNLSQDQPQFISKKWTWR